MCMLKCMFKNLRIGMLLLNNGTNYSLAIQPPDREKSPTLSILFLLFTFTCYWYDGVQKTTCFCFPTLHTDWDSKTCLGAKKHMKKICYFKMRICLQMMSFRDSQIRLWKTFVVFLVMDCLKESTKWATWEWELAYKISMVWKSCHSRCFVFAVAAAQNPCFWITTLCS